MTWGFQTCGPNEALVVSGKYLSSELRKHTTPVNYDTPTISVSQLSNHLGFVQAQKFRDMNVNRCHLMTSRSIFIHNISL